jgi:hypothetical protein
MTHKLSRAIFTGLTIWFIGITAYILIYKQLIVVNNYTGLAILILFSILSIFTTIGIAATEPEEPKQPRWDDKHN